MRNILGTFYFINPVRLQAEFSAAGVAGECFFHSSSASICWTV